MRETQRAGVSRGRGREGGVVAAGWACWVFVEDGPSSAAKSTRDGAGAGSGALAIQSSTATERCHHRV